VTVVSRRLARCVRPPPSKSLPRRTEVSPTTVVPCASAAFALLLRRVPVSALVTALEFSYTCTVSTSPGR